MLTLAAPVVVAEVGWVAMGLVDTLMVGPLGPEAIGAVGIGSSLFIGVVIFAMGLLLGLDTLVSQAYGAGRLDECHRWLVHGAVLSLIVALPVTLVLFALASLLGGWGLDPTVLHMARPYLTILSWSVLPLLFYATFRRYLQGMGVVRPVMIALVMANITNVIVNWVLIYGKLGAPAMGVRGSAWATVLSRVAMAVYLLVVIVQRERGRRPGLFETPLTIELAWMRRLLALGVPAASQITLEVGVFAAATALAGRLTPIALAAHQIAIHIAALSFMVPLGVSSAGAVRVGHALGRRDPAGAERAGWTAILIGAGVHGLHGGDVRARPEGPDGRVHARRRGRAVGCLAARRRSHLSDLRRLAGRNHGSAAGPRRHAYADAVEPLRPLVHRSAGRLRALLRAWARRDRTLVGFVGWSDHLRRRAARGLGTENPGAQNATLNLPEPREPD